MAGDEDTPENLQDIALVEQLGHQLERQEQWKELRRTIGAFLVDFASFESLSLTAVLKELSSDAVLVEHLAVRCHGSPTILQDLDCVHVVPVMNHAAQQVYL